LKHPIFETLEAGTELAIGGGNPLEHPQLNSFLHRMQRKGVVCNLTIHQNEYMKHKKQVDDLVLSRLVCGLGISVGDRDCDLQIDKTIGGRVIFHTIIGITPVSVIQRISQQNKVLLLGNKTQQIDTVVIEELRGYISNFSDKIQGLYFDNLACEQLNVRSLVGESTWNSRYMGDDGMFTMFIDLVQEYGYVSSVDRKNGVSLSESLTIREMFSRIRRILT
jgi:hypothetical protein